ncbi:MAG: hypothetical protein WC838_04390 [Candidatus Margulisiibacteriota bacterium]|jgi:hypothetical protein
MTVKSSDSRYKETFYKELASKKQPVFSHADEVRAIVEEAIIRQIEYISQLQYYIMEKTGDYTDLGEQRVSISYCRLLLKIPTDQEVSQYDADRFRKNIQEARSRFRDLPLDKLQVLEKQEKFNILGREYDTFQDKELNEALAFLGSKKRLTIGFFGHHRSILFGDVVEQNMNGYRIYLQETEEARTPTNCLSIAAIIGEKNVTIRKVAMETIFYNKWVKVFLYHDTELRKLMSSLEGNIREVIKQKALLIYDVHSAQELVQIKELFIDEMVEQVLWHEIGHGLCLESMNEDDAALGEAFLHFEHDIVGVLKEFTADCAPTKGDLRGPLAHFCELALNQGEYSKAARMLMVYLSDNWFLDPNEDFMADQTDVIGSVISKYISPDMRIDFKQLELDLPAIYDRMQVQLLAMVHNVKDKFTNAVYQAGNLRYDYNEVKEMLFKIMEEDRDEFTAPVGTLQYQTTFWMNLFNYAKDHSADVYQSVLKEVSEDKDKVKTQILRELAGQGPAEARFGNDLRQYLYERMKLLGLYEEKKQISILEAVQMAIEETFLPYTQRADVERTIEDILDHCLEQKIAVSTSADLPNPFVTVLQEMLVRGQAGRINDGMAFEDLSPNPSPPSLRKAFGGQRGEDGSVIPAQAGIQVVGVRGKLLKDKILEIKKHFDDGTFQQINELRVNSAYADELTVETILGETILADGVPLSDRIGHVELQAFSENKVMEVFLPISWGYWDWNTVQAIWRINQKIRPYETEKAFILDKLVLQQIVTAYLNS